MFAHFIHTFINYFRRIAEGLGEVIPNLETLILTNNHIQELGDLDPLAELPKLTYLSLLSNPVANKQHYRSYVISKLPNLRVLDFRKVKLKVSFDMIVLEVCIIDIL